MAVLAVKTITFILYLLCKAGERIYRVVKGILRNIYEYSEGFIKSLAGD